MISSLRMKLPSSAALMAMLPPPTAVLHRLQTCRAVGFLVLPDAQTMHGLSWEPPQEKTVRRSFAMSATRRRSPSAKFLFLDLLSRVRE
jgi:hypothetical protein